MLVVICSVCKDLNRRFFSTNLYELNFLLQGEKLYFQVYGLTTVNKVVKQDHGEPNIYLLLKWEHMLYTYTGGGKFLLVHFYLSPFSESEISWVKACFQCQ
jgi:hypothetical protein